MLYLFGILVKVFIRTIYVNTYIQNSVMWLMLAF